VAPAAVQQGAAAARNILRTLDGRAREAFRYRNKGDLATIGRHKAVADFGRFRVTGRTAWWLWLFVHIMYLVGFRNRVSVLVQWAYAYFTYQRGVRLIAEAVPPGGGAAVSVIQPALVAAGPAPGVRPAGAGSPREVAGARIDASRGLP
jgi:NADH dehydrogenase